MGTARAFSRLLTRSRRWLFASIAFAAAQAALIVPGGLLVQHAFDTQIPKGSTGGLVVTGVLIAGLAVASAAIGLAARRLMLSVTKDAIRALRVSLIERLHQLPVSWFDGVEDGVVQSTIVQDTERLDAVTAAFAAQMLPAAIISVALIVALAVIAPVLTLVLAIAFPLVTLVGRLPVGALRRRTHDYQDSFDRLSVRIGFGVAAATLIRTDGAEHHETARGAAEAEAVAVAGKRLFWLQFAAAQLAGLATTLTGIAVLVVGGVAVAERSMTVGTLAAFYALVTPLRGQLGTILSTVPLVVSGMESWRRLNAVLTAEAPRPYAGGRTLAFQGRLTVEDVHFAFPAGVPVLRGVSLELRPGELTGLAGPNGAGKTTVAAMVLGLRRPQSGRVLADGIEFDALDVEALRSSMAIVPQTPLLFPGTIAENIAFAAAEAEPDQIREAAKLATADRVIAALRDGYETRVGDHGKLLSGGQAQRLAIARALIRRPALLILDEPTNHLDAESSRELLLSLRALEWRPAVLVISHEARVLEVADRVYVLTSGRVAERSQTPASTGPSAAAASRPTNGAS